MPKKQFYVGEVVPVDVNAFVPTGMQATVNGLPTMGSEAFTLNPLGNKPGQEEREVNGHDYTVLTWHSAVTAVKAGDFPLSMEMPVTVVVREAPQRRQRSSGGRRFCSTSSSTTRLSMIRSPRWAGKRRSRSAVNPKC